MSGGGGESGTDSNSALGDYSMIPGGRGNKASGAYSFAAGRRAKALGSGSFVWGDATDADITAGSNEFVVRASGGYTLYSNSTFSSGVSLSAGSGTWSSISDSTLKRNINVVDGKEILDKVAQLPIKRWSYKSQDPSIEHIGPMAQDFYALFHLGENNKTISTIDPAGVALAAIQELNKKVIELEQLRARVEKLESLLETLSLKNQRIQGENHETNPQTGREKLTD